MTLESWLILTAIVTFGFLVMLIVLMCAVCRQRERCPPSNADAATREKSVRTQSNSTNEGSHTYVQVVGMLSAEGAFG